MSERDGNLRRRELLELIQRHPGINTSALAKALDISWNTCQYHLGKLRIGKKVKRVRSGKEIHFFLPEAKTSAALASGLRRRLLGLLVCTQHVGITEAARGLSHSTKVIRLHLQVLERNGLATHGDQYHKRYVATKAGEQAFQELGFPEPLTPKIEGQDLEVALVRGG
jgi:predicted ArsR family transcriptional regulator